jgi:hypothetical protein
VPNGQSMEVLAALKRMEERETGKRARDFDRIYKHLFRNWNRLLSSKSLSAFSLLRDKYTAHKEIHLENDRYKLMDLSSLRLKWKDLDIVINLIRLIVRDINLLVRNSSFNYDSFEKGLSSSVKSFWSKKSA